MLIHTALVILINKYCGRCHSLIIVLQILELSHLEAQGEVIVLSSEQMYNCITCVSSQCLPLLDLQPVPVQAMCHSAKNKINTALYSVSQ